MFLSASSSTQFISTTVLFVKRSLFRINSFSCPQSKCVYCNVLSPQSTAMLSLNFLLCYEISSSLWWNHFSFEKVVSGIDQKDCDDDDFKNDNDISNMTN